MKSSFAMPIGEFSMPPLAPWGRYDPAPAGFADLVECLGVVRFDPVAMDQVVIHRLAECRGDLLFLRRRSAPAWTKLVLIGAHDVYAADPLEGAESCALIWFQPGAMGWASGLPANAMRNVIAPLEDVWGAPGAVLHRHLAGIDDDEAVLAAMWDAVRQRPRGAWNAECLETIRGLEASVGSGQLESLVRMSGYGERQLRRIFDAQVGINPKLALRIIRVRAVLGSLRDLAAPNWIALAAEAGFADQAHLSTEIKWFTGMTPTQLLRSRDFGLLMTHEVIVIPRQVAQRQPAFRKERGSMAGKPRLAVEQHDAAG